MVVLGVYGRIIAVESTSLEELIQSSDLTGTCSLSSIIHSPISLASQSPSYTSLPSLTSKSGDVLASLRAFLLCCASRQFLRHPIVTAGI